MIRIDSSHAPRRHTERIKHRATNWYQGCKSDGAASRRLFTPKLRRPRFPQFHGASSPWSLQDWGLHRNGTAAFGLEIAEMTLAGLPIAPRFRLSAQCEGAVVVAACPGWTGTLPSGRHDTLADGPELLTRVAATIDSLGDVYLGKSAIDFGNQLRHVSHRSCLRCTTILLLLLYLEIPPGITSIAIESRRGVESISSYVVNDHTAKTDFIIYGRGEFGVTRGQRLRISLDGLGAVDPESVDRPRYFHGATSPLSV